MSNPESLSCALKNGLSLDCIDQSRKIAADRWFISISIQIVIPVEKKWFPDGSIDDATFQKMVGVLGNEVVFKQKKERHFVSDDMKARIVGDICENAMQTGRQYCGSDVFPARYILKKFAECSTQGSPAHE
jgi:hypothetical protein